MTAMPMTSPDRIVLTDAQRVELDRLARAGRTEQRLALRAGIVLAAADGHPNVRIAASLGICEDTPGAAHQRCRHLRAVSSQIPSDAAIRTLGCPSAAASTMPARSARRCSVRPARANRSSPTRWASVNTMRSGLVIGIAVILERGSHQSHQPHLSHGLCWSTTRRSGTITPMAAPPASTKTSLQQRLSARARERWPELAGIDVKFRGEFAYVTGRLKDGDTQPLMRLRYGGSAARWGFAIYLASKNGYQDSVLPTGAFAGAPEDALDTACGLYLGDPTAWT